MKALRKGSLILNFGTPPGMVRGARTHQDLEGKSIQSHLKDEFFLKPSVFTWIYSSNENGNLPSNNFWGDPVCYSEWFKWNDTSEYKLVFCPEGNRAPGYCSLYLEQKEPPEVSGPPMTFTLVMENWCDPDDSQRATVSGAFNQGNSRQGFLRFGTAKEMEDSKDRDGNLIFHIMELSIANV